MIGLAYIGLSCISSHITSKVFINDELSEVIQQTFDNRNKSIIQKDLKTLKSLYDTNTKLGTWAYEHQENKMKYLYKWAEKQGIKFIDIKSKFTARRLNEKDTKLSAYLTVSTEYKYFYENDPETVNFFRIGTYHSLAMINIDEQWFITKEWYTDPFADSLHLDDIKTEEIKTYILSSEPRDFLNINERRINAVEYADRYCGAAADEEYGYVFNKKYRNYNPLGGDCANFASQILHEGGKFKKTHTWNYDSDGSKAWVNAQAFKDNMIYSGRASLIAYGTYQKIHKSAYKLIPGDFVGYEKKGKVTHISVVTGADSKGYTLVNCHNTDRYRVPWDLGWSDKGIKFWLVRVHY